MWMALLAIAAIADKKTAASGGWRLQVSCAALREFKNSVISILGPAGGVEWSNLESAELAISGEPADGGAWAQTGFQSRLPKNCWRSISGRCTNLVRWGASLHNVEHAAWLRSVPRDRPALHILF